MRTVRFDKPAGRGPDKKPRKQRALKTHCKRGHELVGERGNRACKICKADAKKEKPEVRWVCGGVD